MPEGYLVATREREHEACRRLVKLSFPSERLFGSLGLQSSFAWFILQLRHELLVPSLRGDVDILAGSLGWSDPGAFEALVAQERAKHPDWHFSRHYEMAALKLAQAEGIKWPPPTDHLIGVEAKCAYLDPTAAEISAQFLRSTKSSTNKTDRTRQQVERLLEMGLNHAALLDIVANPPVTGPDGGAWITALGVATESREAMASILSQRLPEDSDAAHWVWSIGSVAGGDEFHRGAGSPIQMRPSKGNPRLANAVAIRSNRKEMEQNINALLSAFPRPIGFPVIFVDCKNCGRLHGISWEDAPCGNN